MKLCSGSKTLPLTCSGNLASDWLRAKRALLWMRKKGLGEKWMTVSMFHSLRTCERRNVQFLGSRMIVTII